MNSLEVTLFSAMIGLPLNIETKSNFIFQRITTHSFAHS